MVIAMLQFRFALIQQVECWQVALVISLNFNYLSIFLFRTIKLWNIEVKKVFKIFKGHASPIENISCGSDGINLLNNLIKNKSY